MTFEERLTWVQAVVMVAVPGWYFVNILGQTRDTSLSEIAYQPLLLWNAGTVIASAVVLSIAATIAVHIGVVVKGEIAKKSGTENSNANSEVDTDSLDRRDERDADIARFGYIGGYVLAVASLVPLGLTLVESEYFWIANALYAALVLSALVDSAVKIVAYRRGF